MSELRRYGLSCPSGAAWHDVDYDSDGEHCNADEALVEIANLNTFITGQGREILRLDDYITKLKDGIYLTEAFVLEAQEKHKRLKAKIKLKNDLISRQHGGLIKSDKKITKLKSLLMEATTVFKRIGMSEIEIQMLIKMRDTVQEASNVCPKCNGEGDNFDESGMCVCYTCQGTGKVIALEVER